PPGRACGRRHVREALRQGAELCRVRRERPAPAPHRRPSGGRSRAVNDVPTLARIRAARARLGDLVVTTPVRRWQDEPLAAAAGAQTEVYLKEELFQRTGTFKPRGALSVMLDLEPHARARGVTAVSAGNHAIAVGYA